MDKITEEGLEAFHHTGLGNPQTDRDTGLGRQLLKSQPSTQKESWEEALLESSVKAPDDWDEYIQVSKAREIISQAITADREALIQRIQKKKVDEAWLLKLPDVVRESAERTNELIDDIISLIKEH